MQKVGWMGLDAGGRMMGRASLPSHLRRRRAAQRRQAAGGRVRRRAAGAENRRWQERTKVDEVQKPRGPASRAMGAKVEGFTPASWCAQARSGTVQTQGEGVYVCGGRVGCEELTSTPLPRVCKPSLVDARSPCLSCSRCLPPSLPPSLRPSPPLPHLITPSPSPSPAPPSLPVPLSGVCSCPLFFRLPACLPLCCPSPLVYSSRGPLLFALLFASPLLPSLSQGERIVDQIVKFGKVSRSVLGISFALEQLVEQLGVGGVLVLDAPLNDPAGNAANKTGVL